MLNEAENISPLAGSILEQLADALIYTDTTGTLQGRPTLTRAKHQSGRKLYVEMTFALVKEGGASPRGAVAVARDVTERVEQQKAASRQ